MPLGNLRMGASYQGNQLIRLWGVEKGWWLNQLPVADDLINGVYVMKPP